MASVSNVRLKRRNKRNRRIIIVMGVLLIGIFALKSYELNKRIQSYESEIAYLNEEYEEQENITKELEEQEKYVQTKKFAEEYAKEHLGLIYPNEVVFKAK